MRKFSIFRASGSDALFKILASHPGVDRIDAVEEQPLRIVFIEDDQLRFALQAVPTVEGPYGLIELMDNNPLVCAKQASVPGAAATLSLIALGPLARAEMLASAPTISLNFEDDGAEISPALETEGWSQGYSLERSSLPAKGRVLEAIVDAPLKETVTFEDVETLFDDLYGRSFFVRSARELPENAVEGSPYARYEWEEFTSLPSPKIRIKVQSDRDGKTGTAQVVHLFNIMAGFEEDLGLGNRLDVEQF